MKSFGMLLEIAPYEETTFGKEKILNHLFDPSTWLTGCLSL
jgi:hypothetical protein